MKSQFTKSISIICLWFIFGETTFTQKLPSVVIGGCEAKNLNIEHTTIADVFMLEYKKLNLFDMYNPHDAFQEAAKNQIEINACFTKTCLKDLGRILNVDKAVSCQMEKFNDKIYISIRQIDIQTNTVEKNFSYEFLAIEKEIQLMVELTIKKMYGVAYDEQKLLQLTTVQSPESTLNNPNIAKLNLSGPRFGFGYIHGNDGKSFQRPVNEGGYNAFPVLSQFGYQFEVAYLNQGSIQGLFEFIPTLSGIEHGTVIPSIALLHGIRSNKNGFEFSVGPLLSVTRRADGFYDDNNKWIRIKDYFGTITKELESKISREIDRKGEFTLEGGLVMAVGKSFRSGNVNFPVNFYAVLKKGSPRFGFSMGFNTKK